jgi:integrase
MKKLKEPTPWKNLNTGKWGCSFEEVVDGKIKRRRKHCKYTRKEDAAIHCTKIFNKQNPKARKGITKLTNAEQDEALWAFEELAKFDVKKNSLRSAIRYYVDNYKESGETRDTHIIVEEWLKKKKQELQPSSYAPIKSRFDKFKQCFDCKFGEIESKELIKFIEKYTEFEDLPDGTSRKGELRAKAMQKKLFTHLKSFYAHACNPANPDREMNYNPWDRVAFYFDGKFKETNNVPTILHIKEVKQALRMAKAFKSEKGQAGEFLGTLVLGALCGLRPSEVKNLSEQQDVFNEFVQLKKKQLRITEDICMKMRDVRTVALKENAVEWLTYIKDQKLPIYPTPYVHQKYNGKFREAILGKRSTDKQWNDVYRHTFVTFLYCSALEGKEKLSFDYITSQAGHSMQVQEKHYRGILHDDEAASDYWDLTPSSVEKD